MTKRRYVYHLCGYGPIGAGWYRVFKRELAKFARTWNISSQVLEVSEDPATSSPHWQVTTSAPNWRVETGYGMLVWDDIILSDFARPITARLARSSLAFLDFMLTGSVARYFKANWQYGIFFLFPFVLLFVFFLVSVVIAYYAAGCLVRHAVCGHFHRPVALAWPAMARTTRVGRLGFFVGVRARPPARRRSKSRPLCRSTGRALP
jgi:hypothetical protein